MIILAMKHTEIFKNYMNLSKTFFSFTVYFLFSFYTFAEPAKHYEDALATFKREKFAESYIHLKNALQQSPMHLPSKLLMGRILLIDGFTEDAITEFEEVIAAGADKNLVIIPLANAYLIKLDYQRLLSLTQPNNASKTTELELLLLKVTAHIRLRQYIQAKAILIQNQVEFAQDIRIINGLAQIALIEKQYDEARVMITKSLNIDSKNGQSVMFSGLIYQAQNRHEDAMKEFIKAYQYSPKNPSIKRSLANSYAQAGMVEAAGKLVKEIEQQSPGDLQVKLLKARLLAMAEKNNEANIVLNELSSMLSLADATQKGALSNISLTAGITAYINKNYTVSAREIERYISNSETNPSLIAMLADSYIKSNNIKKATQTLEKYETLVLDDISISITLCDLYLVRNRLFKCLSLMEELKSRYGKHKALILLEAKLLDKRELTEQALSLLEDQLKSDNSVEVLLFHTGLLVKMGRIDEAMISAKRLLHLEPQNIAYINLNIDLLIRVQKLTEAKSMLQRVFKQQPDSVAGQINQARIMFAQENHSSALSILNGILKEQPSHPIALLLSGQILSKQERYDEAIEQLIAIKIIEQDNTAPRELLVNIYKQQNKFEIALREVNQLLNFTRFEPIYILEKAKLLIKLNDLEQAKSQLNILFDEWSNNATQLIELSQYQLVVKDLIGAEKSLKLAQIIAPNLLIAKLEYAKYLVNQNRLTEAENLLIQLQKINPNDPNILFISGQYNKAIGQNEKAYFAFKRTFEISPNFTLALIELYQLASQGTHTGEIQQLILNHINRQPDDNFHRHLLADLYFIEKEFNKASRHYEKLILIENLPNKANIYNNLANIFSSIDIDKAMFYAQEAVNLNPNSSSILDTQGWLYTKNNNPQKALNVLRQAYTLNSDSPTIRYHLAYTLNKLGRSQEAKTELALALRSEQKFQERAQAQSLLLEL
jgi:putative PEP-CTERM system TPR-repeat lipoprotein